ncbi:MAG: sugar ABC transporter permease [Acholeplasmataceae bacterium]|nr:sugar ABC transporter permease [Acholeplasmataceae bacterium]
MTKTKKSRVNYNRYGLYFIAPFFIVYIIFSLIPLLSTFYYSFFEYYMRQGIIKIGPNFIFLDNYAQIFQDGILFKYAGNTLIMWLMGFIPQIIISLLLALWFTSTRLKIKNTGFYKTIMYMPNLVMASAFSMLFLQIFAKNGPVVNLLMDGGYLQEQYDFFAKTISTRSLIALMNFLMWFGNTTILLMAGIMGIDQTILESASVDGANSRQIFIKIIIPLLKPIILFVLITSLIGGIQMFDIPQILTEGNGGPNLSTKTMIMYLHDLITTSKNYGLAGAVSVVLFIITGGLSVIVFRAFRNNDMVDVKSTTRK